MFSPPSCSADSGLSRPCTLTVRYKRRCEAIPGHSANPHSVLFSLSRAEDVGVLLVAAKSLEPPCLKTDTQASKKAKRKSDTLAHRSDLRFMTLVAASAAEAKQVQLCPS